MAKTMEQKNNVPDIGEVLYTILANQVTILDLLKCFHRHDINGMSEISQQLIKMDRTSRDLLKRMQL